jgi:hypothetical protein
VSSTNGSRRFPPSPTFDIVFLVLSAMSGVRRRAGKTQHGWR